MKRVVFLPASPTPRDFRQRARFLPCGLAPLALFSPSPNGRGRSSGVEHNLAKVRVVSSNLIARSNGSSHRFSYRNYIADITSFSLMHSNMVSHQIPYMHRDLLDKCWTNVGQKPKNRVGISKLCWTGPIFTDLGQIVGQEVFHAPDRRRDSRV